jgi:hypothetical protein
MNSVILSAYLTLLSISLQNLSLTLEQNPVIPPPAAITLALPESEQWIRTRVNHYAEKYGVAESTMNKIVQCESGFDPKAKGDFSTTTQEYTSFGLVQINLPHNKNVTKEEAFNVEYALDFLASGLSQGRGSRWTCFRQLFD